MFKRILLFLLGIIYSLSSMAQGALFLPEEQTNKLYSYNITANGSYKPPTTYSDSLPVTSSVEYGSLTSGTFLIKSVQDYVFVGVNHDTASVISSAYTYNVSLTIWCLNPSATPVPKYLTLKVSYNPDSGKSYVDANIFKFSGYHRLYAVVTDIRDAATNAVISRSSLPANFYVSATVSTERYNTNSFTIYPSCSVVDAGKTLHVKWFTGAPGGGDCDTSSSHLDIAPIEYELEWQYIDDYGYTFSGSDPGGTSSYLLSSSSTGIPYDFRHNSTRVRLDSPSFYIPLIYEHGAIIYRIRTIRPDYTDGYKSLLYSGWNMSDVGTVDANKTCHIYLISTPHDSDKLNWQYTINFAEEGKYKHVINYFDGSLRNRQTQTKINTDKDNIVVADKVYDYEGRASIQTLPTPIKQATLEYKDSTIINSATSHVYVASDFDHASCSTPDSIAPLATTALSRVYYSPANTDTISGMQKFVPDAKGYPFVQSIYTPDNLLSWQGGAGYDMQLWKNHATHYEYMRATQPELDNLFWEEAGQAQFYSKQVITDPNGQSSFIIQNHKGQTVATGLIGLPDTSTIPIDVLPGSDTGAKECFNIMTNVAQDRTATSISVNTPFYADKNGTGSLQYSLRVPAFPISMPRCSTTKYLWTKASYSYSATNDCGVASIPLTSGVLGKDSVLSSNVSSYFSSSVNNQWLLKGKYFASKQLTFSPSEIHDQINSFVLANEPNCFYDVKHFVKESIVNTSFPCIDSNIDDPCAAKRKLMKSELWPGAKYGTYYKNINGSVHVDTICGNELWFCCNPNPSIFSVYWIPSEDYICPGVTLVHHYYQRYHAPCITFPDTVVKDGRIYTNIASLPVDTFVYIFNDDIAEALLPIHPEYCKLSTCGEDYDVALQKLTTYKQAEINNRFYLDSIINHDPLYINASSTDKPGIKLKLSYFKNSSKRLDTMAIEEAYCSAGNLDEAMHCVKYLHQNEIKNFVFTDSAVKQTFFEQLMNYYLVNRAFVAQRMIDAAGSCEPCSIARVPSVIPPVVFQTVFTADGSGLDTSLHVPGWIDSLFHVVLTNDTANLHAAPSNTQDSIDAAKAALASSQIDYIMKKLSNCSSNSTSLAQIRTNLEGYVASGGVDALNVANIESAITTGTGLSLNDLCHPFLADLTSTDFDQDRDYPYDCGSPDLYVGLKELLNRSQITSLMKTATLSGSTATSFSLSGNTNAYEAKIATNLSVSNTATINGKSFLDTVQIVDPSNPSNVYIYKYVKIKLYTSSGTDTFKLYLRRKSSDLAYLDTVTGTIVADTVFCLNNDDDLAYTGYVAQNTAVADLFIDGSAMHSRYLVWSNAAAIMSPASNTSLVACTNCLDLKKALDDFKTDKSVYHYDDAYNHPLFTSTITNYLNYKLHKKYSYTEYLDLMNGCAVTDKTVLKKHFATIRLNCTTDTNTVINNIRSFNPRNIIDSRIKITSTGQTQLGIDLNGVPEDSLLYYITYISGLVSGGNYTYLPNAPTRVFNPAACTPATSLSTYMSPYSTTAVSYYVSDLPISYNMYEFSGSYSNAKDQSDKIVGCNTFAIQCPGAIVYGDAAVLRSSDYINTDKQNYLTYIYGLTNTSRYEIADSISPNNLKLRVSGYSGNTLDYQDPNCTNNKRDLYIYNAGQSANSTFTTIINEVKQSFDTTGMLFPSIGTLVTPGHVGGLTIFQKANGVAWYRYFDANDNLYNVYLVPPTDPPFDIHTLIYDSLHIGPGMNDVYKFTIYAHYSGLGSEVVECKGYTDFPIGTGRKVANVVLYDKPGSYTCVDSADCEFYSLQSAIVSGQTRYQQYYDSTTDALSDSMLYFVVNNATDSLNLCSQAMRNQITLYYHDLAGNLVKTVPPAGFYRYLPDGDSKISTYHYDALNELTYQKTPDGGITKFWYNLKGNPVYSQNSRQRQEQKYSYTLYDDQDRVIETGEAEITCPGSGCPELVNPHLYTNSWIASFVGGFTRTDVVRTFYDDTVLNLSTKIGYGLSPQENLIGRVSAIYFYFVLGGGSPVPQPQFATYYSYDAMGNVKTITYDCAALQDVKQEFKRVDYDYDQISGKVNMLSYNRGQADQIFHKYTYDADNRITDVHTSTDGIIWNRDASYNYYKHGPLAQMKIGDDQIQSVEYAYTIQGWLKAINSDVLKPERDMGGNGKSTDRSYARDVIAMALNYFKNDYKPIAKTPATYLAEPAKNLYNGNIAEQTLSENSFGSLRRTYRYDQVQRIKLATYASVDEDALSIASPSNIYKNSYEYDGDGNIKTLVRYDNTGTKMDSLLYNYPFGSNQLQYAREQVNITSVPYDIEKPAVDVGQSYFYDSTGQLIKDEYNNQRIAWNAYGKVKSITDTVTGELVTYEYDGVGNRVRKDVIGQADSLTEYHTGEYYVNDAQGNVLATYNFNGTYSPYSLIAAANDGLQTNANFPSFVVDKMAGYGDFYNQFVTRAISNDASWGASYAPPTGLSFYALNDNDIYYDVLTGTPDYMNGVQTSDNMPTHNTPFPGSPIPAALIIPDALVSAGSSASGVLSPVLDYSTERTTLFLYFDEYLSPMSSSLWSMFGVSYTPGNPSSNASNMDSYLSSNPTSKSGVLAQIMSVIQTDEMGGGINSKAFFYELMEETNFLSGPPVTTSGNVFTSTNLRSTTPPMTGFETAIGGVLYSYANRSLLCSILASWTGGNTWLSMNTDWMHRLPIKVKADPITAISDFLTNTSDYASLDHAIAATYKLKALNYAQWVVNDPVMGGLTTLSSYDIGLGKDTLSLAQHHIYGSSKLGMQNYPAPYSKRSTYSVDAGTPDTSLRKITPWYSYDYADLIKPGYTEPWGHGYTDSTSDTITTRRFLAYRWYNMTDHQGNILAVVQDRKSGVTAGKSPAYDHWNANLADITDYYPFGMKMPGRLLLDSNSYGYNSQRSERDMYKSVDANLGKYDVHYEYRFREFDPRLGRFWSVDPLAARFPYNSSYAFAENKLGMGVEFEGLELVANNTGYFSDNGNSVDTKNKNIPSVLKNANGTPRFSASAMGLSINGKLNDKITFLAPMNNLPENPEWKMGPEDLEQFKDVENSKGMDAVSGINEIGKYNQLLKDRNTWNGLADLQNQINKFDEATKIRVPLMSINIETQKSWQAALINFAYDGSLPAPIPSLGMAGNAARNIKFMNTAIKVLNDNQIPVREATMQMFRINSQIVNQFQKGNNDGTFQIGNLN